MFTFDVTGERYRLDARAYTVILTDNYRAILFTAWSRKDIEQKMAEHFPAEQTLTIYVGLAVPPDWPKDKVGNLAVNRLEILCSDVPCFINWLEVQEKGGELPCALTG